MFFLFGFILLASLFAAAAAMVSRQEDIGSTTTPLTMLIMAPYFLVIFFNDNPTVLAIMSYVPFSAPVGMPMRLFLGEAQWWEPLLSLAILIATCVAAILVGARIYENSLLRMGARVKLREALRADRPTVSHFLMLRGSPSDRKWDTSLKVIWEYVRMNAVECDGPTATRSHQIYRSEVDMTIPLLTRTAEADAPVLDVLADRWSPRAFAAADAIAETRLASALEAARWAPSANKVQPWRFIVAGRGPEAHDRIDQALLGFDRVWAGNAAVLMIAVAETVDAEGRPLDFAAYDLGQAVAHLSVQAHHDGLHVHLMGGFDRDAVREAFDLDARSEPLTAITLGPIGDASDLLRGAAGARVRTARPPAARRVGDRRLTRLDRRRVRTAIRRACAASPSARRWRAGVSCRRGPKHVARGVANQAMSGP